MVNLLFLTLLDIRSIENHGLYEDLLRELEKRNHNIYIVSPIERRIGQETHVICDVRSAILKVKIGNVQKTNIIEKGLSTCLIEHQLIYAIKRFFATTKFDAVIYSTPPITFANVVAYIKKRDNAKACLLLKDIFPQNAVDLGMLSKSGLKGVLYYYFRKKEEKLYRLSDHIGCMSQANVDYILKNNPWLDMSIVSICPNCAEPVDMSISNDERNSIRAKYGIPTDKMVFIYGGNLGKPQDIPFIINCLKTQETNHGVFFVMVGDGTEYPRLESYFDSQKPTNAMLLKRLPKEEFDSLVGSSDVGMLFLDHRFTIPNFPSRLLSYMQAHLPVLAITDKNTDVGRVIEANGFGWWCESNEVENFAKAVELIQMENAASINRKKDNAYKCLITKYASCIAAEEIVNRINKR